MGKIIGIDLGTTNSEVAVIEAGKTLDLKMYVTPACDTWGDYEITFNTKAKLSNAEAETKGILLKIDRAYDFSLEFGRIFDSALNTTPSFEEYPGN